MDHVAETLFGMQQDGLALEVGAVPKRLGEIAGQVLAQLPPPFVFLEALLEVAFLQQAERPVPTAVRVFGGQFQRFIEASDGFFRLAGVAQDEAEVVMGLGRIGGQLDGVAVGGGGDL